jgi:tetratricopeptide (TPR) repeat protein
MGLRILFLLGVVTLATPAAADTDAARAAFDAGHAQRRAGANKEAVQELRRASNLNPDKDLALKIQYELARTAIDRRDFGQAMAQCRVLGQKPGGKALGHACAAEAYLLWRRASEANEEAKRALADDPKLYEAKVAQGRARFLELKDTEAEAALREAVSIKPDALEAWLALAELHALFGKTDAASNDLREALKRDEHSPEASFQLGKLLAPGPEAIAHLEAALRERPSYGEALARLAEVQIALNKLDAARASAQRALKSDPNDASMRVVVGRVALAEGKPDVAHSEAKAALAILPNLASAKLLVADAYAKQNEIDLALENYQAAFGLDRADPNPLVRASEACRTQNRETSARAFAERATRDFPEWGPAWLALGDALAVQKDIPGARQAYERALKARGIADLNDVRRRIEKLK